MSINFAPIFSYFSNFFRAFDFVGRWWRQLATNFQCVIRHRLRAFHVRKKRCKPYLNRPTNRPTDAISCWSNPTTALLNCSAWQMKKKQWKTSHCVLSHQPVSFNFHQTLHDDDVGVLSHYGYPPNVFDPFSSFGTWVIENLAENAPIELNCL